MARKLCVVGIKRPEKLKKKAPHYHDWRNFVTFNTSYTKCPKQTTDMLITNGLGFFEDRDTSLENFRFLKRLDVIIGPGGRWKPIIDGRKISKRVETINFKGKPGGFATMKDLPKLKEVRIEDASYEHSMNRRSELTDLVDSFNEDVFLHVDSPAMFFSSETNKPEKGLLCADRFHKIKLPSWNKVGTPGGKLGIDDVPTLKQCLGTSRR